MVTKEIRNVFLNKKGNSFLHLVIVIFIFIGISTLVMDYGNMNIKSKKIKYAVNRSVKAGTLQILEGEELSKGNFLIDDSAAYDAFKTILAHNLGLNETSLAPLEKSLLHEEPIIREFSVENSFPTVYTSPTISENYPIENPSIVAVIDFKIRGIFFSRTIRVAKLSSSQLTSIYP